MSGDAGGSEGFTVTHLQRNRAGPAFSIFSRLTPRSVKFLPARRGEKADDAYIKSATFNMRDDLFTVQGFIMPGTTDSRKTKRWHFITPSALLILAAVVCLLTMPASAHAPTDMNISFDPTTAKIYVTITHPVDDPATHYLSRVKVKLNGDVISDPDYKSQRTKDTFTLTYDVNAHSGDEVWVTATCVRGGVLEKTYKVPEPVRVVTSAQVPSTYQTQPPATVPPATRSPAGTVSVLGAVAALLVLGRR